MAVDLGEVHVAAAAEAKHRVRIEFAGSAHAVGSRLEGWFRFAAGEDLDGDAGFVERRVDVFDESALEQHLIGNDEDALEAVADGDVAELLRGAGTEDE